MTIEQELLAWAAPNTQKLGLNFTQAQPIDGDAGFRQYHRLNTEPPILAVYGPPAVENHQAFVDIAAHWRHFDIVAPIVYAFDATQGFLLVEDFGCQALADTLAASKTLPEVAAIYAPVLAQLRQLQNVPTPVLDSAVLSGSSVPPTYLYPAYNADLLANELALFEPWFVEGLLAYRLSAQEKAQLHALYQPLIDSAIAQPQVIVHRDFHCRNIQVLRQSQGQPLAPNSQHPLSDWEQGLIDFQDAVIGPITYDCVSLLKDCYQNWPSHFVIEQAEQYRLALPAHLQMPHDEWHQAFDWMGLQRHLKVLGIFARLYLRDGKAGYLSDLPQVIAYVRHTGQKYPALKPFMQWFDAVILPLCEAQPWYVGIEIQ